jgi:hypothetical protein
MSQIGRREGIGFAGVRVEVRSELGAIRVCVGWSGRRAFKKYRVRDPSDRDEQDQR